MTRGFKSYTFVEFYSRKNQTENNRCRQKTKGLHFAKCLKCFDFENMCPKGGMQKEYKNAEFSAAFKTVDLLKKL